MIGYWKMSNVMIDELLSNIGPSTFAVYAVLVRHADKEGIAFPGRRKIAKMAGVGQSTITDCLNILVRKTLIEISKQGNKNIYRILNVPGDGNNETEKVPATGKNAQTNVPESGTSDERTLPTPAEHVPESDTCNEGMFPIPAPHVPESGNAMFLLQEQKEDPLKEDTRRKNKPPSPKDKQPTPSSPGDKTQARNYTPAFDTFWESYPRRDGRRAGSKAEAFDEWINLDDEDQKLLLIAIPNYAADAGDFPKNASRFIKKSIYRDYLKPDENRPLTDDEQCDLASQQILQLRREKGMSA